MTYMRLMQFHILFLAKILCFKKVLEYFFNSCVQINLFRLADIGNVILNIVIFTN